MGLRNSPEEVILSNFHVRCLCCGLPESFSVSTVMSLGYQQARWPDVCSRMPDSQIRHTGYISRFNEEFTNYAISTLCNYQGVQEGKKKKKALFVSIKIQRTYAIMFFNNFQVFNSAILRFNKSQWTGKDRK